MKAKPKGVKGKVGVMKGGEKKRYGIGINDNKLISAFWLNNRFACFVFHDYSSHPFTVCSSLFFSSSHPFTKEIMVAKSRDSYLSLHLIPPAMAIHPVYSKSIWLSLMLTILVTVKLEALVHTVVEISIVVNEN
ncbi:unnamed protein product [Lupinus luteus]|uniref:Uncharacterized protein n=1 Tax=Lupinus luteus TaxID=3873 RepID=A0AAV1W868_LUPLU